MHTLQSLYSLLLRWSSTDEGIQALQGIPRSAELDSKLTALSHTLKAISGSEPSSDQIAEAFSAIC